MKFMTALLSLFLVGGFSLLHAETSLKQVELSISGMTCESCALGAQFALQRMEGVTSAKVSYAESKGVIVYDPQRASIERMIQAVKETGYGASVLKDPVAYEPGQKKEDEQVASHRETFRGWSFMGWMRGGNCRERMAAHSSGGYR